MEKKYRVYRIAVKGQNAVRCNEYTDDIKLFKRLIAQKHNVRLIQVELSFETNEPYTGRDR